MTADKVIARAATTMSALHIELEEPVPLAVALRAQQAVASIVATYLDDPTASEDQLRLEQMRPRTEAEAHAVVNMALSYAGTRRQLAGAREIDEEQAERYRVAANLLSDLDRCEHGRHGIDRCLMCPGGQSTGNLLLPVGTTIGYTVHGVPIAMPSDPTRRGDPRNWVSPPAARDD